MGQREPIAPFYSTRQNAPHASPALVLSAGLFA
jgi:hypothetical protein